MDSLLANYASSDDEGEAEEVSRPISTSKLSSLSTTLPPPKSSSFFSSLPPPRSATSSSPSPSSSLFSSLPPPKSQLPNHSLDDYKREDDGEKPYRQQPSSSIFSSLPPPKTSSSTFSSLPAPKSQSGNPSNKPSLDQNAKRVVPFTIPLNPSMLRSQDPDDEEEMVRKVRKDAPTLSAPKSLSSMLPAPKNSIFMAPAQSLGVSRRSTLQTDALPPNFQQESKAEKEEDSFANYSTYSAEEGVVAGHEIYGSYGAAQGVNDYGNFTNDDGNGASGAVNPAAITSVDSTYASIPAITGCEQDNGNSFGYRRYMDNWSDVSEGATTSGIPDIGRIAGKRGRTDIPTEIVEVKQDELMKNRPREDQVKSTGIAFGPAYQPTPSGKGKPSKLHKRKHQIGSLYYDLKQKEMELAERRSKGLLTKAETQAKYGW